MIKTEHFDDYKAHNAVNSSLLKRLRISPATAFGVEEVPSTAAMDFGRAYHSYILEPETFDSEYFIYDSTKRPEPEMTFGAKANKEWKAEQFETAAAENKAILESSDYLRIQLMAAQLRQNLPHADKLIRNTVHERSIYQTMQINGEDVEVKCRVDGLNEKGVIFDLKTTKNAHPALFWREAGDYAYHLQMAFYKQVVELEFGRPFNVVIIAQEQEAPFNSGFYAISDNMIEKGNREVAKWMKLAQHVRHTGELSSYEIFSNDPFGILSLDIPDYYVNDYDLNI